MSGPYSVGNPFFSSSSSCDVIAGMHDPSEDNRHTSDEESAIDEGELDFAELTFGESQRPNVAETHRHVQTESNAQKSIIVGEMAKMSEAKQEPTGDDYLPFLEKALAIKDLQIATDTALKVFQSMLAALKDYQQRETSIEVFFLKILQLTRRLDCTTTQSALQIIQKIHAWMQTHSIQVSPKSYLEALDAYSIHTHLERADLIITQFYKQHTFHFTSVLLQKGPYYCLNCSNLSPKVIYLLIRWQLNPNNKDNRTDQITLIRGWPAFVSVQTNQTESELKENIRSYFDENVSDIDLKESQTPWELFVASLKRAPISTPTFGYSPLTRPAALKATSLPSFSLRTSFGGRHAHVPYPSEALSPLSPQVQAPATPPFKASYPSSTGKSGMTPEQVKRTRAISFNGFPARKGQ